MNLKEFHEKYSPLWQLEKVRGDATFITIDSAIIVGFGPYYFMLYGPTPDGEPIPFGCEFHNPDDSLPIPELIVEFVESPANNTGTQNAVPRLKLKPYKPAPDPFATLRPEELHCVFPKEEERVCPTPTVRASFFLTSSMREAMTVNGRIRMDNSWFVLHLDGIDITEECDVAITLSDPPTYADVLYRYRPAPLSEGEHALSISFLRTPDSKATYSWEFTVSKDISCEEKLKRPPSRIGGVPSYREARKRRINS